MKPRGRWFFWKNGYIHIGVFPFRFSAVIRNRFYTGRLSPRSWHSHARFEIEDS